VFQPCCLDEHLSRPTVTGWLQQSTRDLGLASRRRAASSCPCLTLLRMGVAWPRILLPAPVVSYATFSPLPPPWGTHDRAVCLCGPIQQVTGQRPAPAPGVTRHPALWSADFPRSGNFQTALIRPTWASESYNALGKLSTISKMRWSNASGNTAGSGKSLDKSPPLG